MKKYATMGLMFLLILGLFSGCGQNAPKQENPPAAPAEEEESYQSGPQVELYAYDAQEDQQYITICELAQGESVTPENIIKAYHCLLYTSIQKARESCVRPSILTAPCWL